MKKISDLLNLQQKKLLDTSRNNRLINYKMTNTTIEVTSEWPQNVFRRLAGQGKSIIFRPKIENANEKEFEIVQGYLEESSDEDGFDLSSETGDEFNINEFRVSASYLDYETTTDEELGSTSHIENAKEVVQEFREKNLINRGNLLTNHSNENLRKRLIGIQRDMRRFNKELGTNPYYLTLGMLEWADQKRNQEMNTAPLVLIPVAIIRKNRFSDFEIRYTEEEVEYNVTLFEKLREDYEIDISPQNAIRASNIQDYFSYVEIVIQEYGWKVDKAKITLAKFSPKKFLMNRDLKNDSWPTNLKPETHPTLSRLLNGNSKKAWHPSHQQTHIIDSFISPMENYQIYDADSSQLIAINHVRNGYDLIIQGPPGTGKSQTITNIIAQAMADGKTVLFIAQKETALNVVKSKLDKAELGHLCLELHRDKAKREVFLNDIQRTLDRSNEASVEVSAQQALESIQGLIKLRDKLNDYSKSLNISVTGEEVTPFQCFEELLRLQQILQDANPPIWLDKYLFEHVRTTAYQEWLPKIENLQMLLAEIGMPKDNVFRFCQYDEDVFIAPEQTKQVIQRGKTTLNDLQAAAVELTDHLGISTPTTQRQVQLLIHLSEYILQAPSLDKLAIHSHKWQRSSREFSNIISALRKSDELQHRYNKILRPTAWTQNIAALQEQILANSNSIQRYFNLATKIPDELAQLCITEPPSHVQEQLTLLSAISEFQNHQKIIKDQEPLLRELLGGENWRKICSDWKHLSNLNNWLNGLHQIVQTTSLFSSVFDYLESGVRFDELRITYELVENHLKQHESAIMAIISHLKLNEKAQFGKNHQFITQTFPNQEILLNAWLADINQLKDIIDYNRVKNSLIEDGFSSVVELGEVWSKASLYLADTVRYSWYLYLINHHGKHNPELTSFNRVAHEASIQKFSNLDMASFEKNQSHLASKHNNDVLELYEVGNIEIGNQLQLLKSQFMNAGAKLSIRNMMEEAGNVIQTLKPVFMMDPTSVADFLPPAKVVFDLVIFDEASQIRPEDATGAILRGKQTVVVGDRHQLPPTNFFATSTDYNNEPEKAIDAESILDLFYIGNIPETTLLWHYRSQHHSLIAPSNHTFYNNKLVVFPSPKVRDSKLGVSLFYVPDSIYDVGKSRTNLVEARYVAQAVMDHAATEPNLSLGVVALHEKQAEAIEHEISLLRSQNPSFNDFLDTENDFLVTNLESIQGDERDVIFISIGYGFSKDGRLILNFGPISKSGGHRRLNVLATRARKRCVVFSSIRGRDIFNRNPRSQGAKFLAEYLEYAETGLMESYTEIQQALHTSEDYQQKRKRRERLFTILNKQFNLEEIKVLCFQLDIDYEDLSGDTKKSKALDLALHFHRRDNMKQLILVGKQQRPEINWDELLDETSPDPKSEKNDTSVQTKAHGNSVFEDAFDGKRKQSSQFSQLETEVKEILQTRGYFIETHVGPPNAAIPIAVMDEQRQTALLGIEFDGSEYYQARSARDRDRLRRQELEKLQWKIHRIWIIDWYYNKEREINRLIQVINNIQLNGELK